MDIEEPSPDTPPARILSRNASFLSKSEGKLLERFLNAIEPFLQSLALHAVFMGHQDEFDRYQKYAGFEQQVVREALKEEGNHEQKQSQRDDDGGPRIQVPEPRIVRVECGWVPGSQARRPS